MLTVSVVIPARNDGAALGTAVESVRAQQGVAISEIAIAVGPSTDDTKAEADRLAAADPGILVLDNPTGSTPAGLNIAIANTTGDVVVRVDARSQLPPDYIQHALETMNATGAANVGAIQKRPGRPQPNALLLRPCTASWAQAGPGTDTEETFERSKPRI